MLAKYKRLLDKLRKIELFCAISVFGFIMLIITMQVIFRYFFNKPFSWLKASGKTVMQDGNQRSGNIPSYFPPFL